MIFTSTICAEPRHQVLRGGLRARVIAEIKGWEEQHVEKIIRRYVGRHAATKAAIRQLNDARVTRGT